MPSEIFDDGKFTYFGFKNNTPQPAIFVVLESKKAELRKKNSITNEFENYGLNLRQKKQNLQKKLNDLMHGVVDDILKIYEELGYRVELKVLIC